MQLTLWQETYSWCPCWLCYPPLESPPLPLSTLWLWHCFSNCCCCDYVNLVATQTRLISASFAHLTWVDLKFCTTTAWNIQMAFSSHTHTPIHTLAQSVRFTSSGFDGNEKKRDGWGRGGEQPHLQWALLSAVANVNWPSGPSSLSPLSLSFCLSGKIGKSVCILIFLWLGRHRQCQCQQRLQCSISFSYLH